MRKKTGKGSPLSAVTLQKIDKHATETSQKLNYAHNDQILHAFDTQRAAEKNSMQKRGNSIVLLHSEVARLSTEIVALCREGGGKRSIDNFCQHEDNCSLPSLDCKF